MKYLEKLSKLPQINFNGNVTKLGVWTYAGFLAQAETKGLSRGNFSAHVHAANKETHAETETAQASFSGQRMEKWEPGSQANFLTQFGQRHQIYRRVQVKEGKLESRRNTHVLSENRAVV